MTVLCGYCGEPIQAESKLDDHLPVCPKAPFWVKRRAAEKKK